MIRYALQCDSGHGFESWFADGPAFDSLSRGGHLSCPVCGNVTISKALMAPSLRGPRKAATEGGESAGEEAAGAPAAAVPDRETVEKALAALRAEVEKNSEYVGMNFATEARRIHDGEAPGRSIYGEAKPEEARKLIEDGVHVAPLPFVPRRKTN